MRYRKENGQWKEVTPIGVSREEFDEVKQDLTHNYYTKTEVDNKSITVDVSSQITKSSVVNSLSAKKNGKILTISVEFTPTKSGEVILSNTPSCVQYRFYIPAIKYNTGACVDGGVWFDNNTFTYYGNTATFNTKCVSYVTLILA